MFVRVAKVSDIPDPGKQLIEVDERLLVFGAKPAQRLFAAAFQRVDFGGVRFEQLRLARGQLCIGNGLHHRMTRVHLEDRLGADPALLAREQPLELPVGS